MAEAAATPAVLPATAAPAHSSLPITPAASDSPVSTTTPIDNETADTTSQSSATYAVSAQVTAAPATIEASAAIGKDSSTTASPAINSSLANEGAAPTTITTTSSKLSKTGTNKVKKAPAPTTKSTSTEDTNTEDTFLLPEPLKSNEQELNEAIASAPRVKGQPAITINRILGKQAEALGLQTAQYELARKYVKIASALGSNPTVSDLRAAFQLDKQGLESRADERRKRAQRAMRMQENSSMRRHRLARESAEKSFDGATDAQLQRIADADLSVFSEFEIVPDTTRRTGPPVDPGSRIMAPTKPQKLVLKR